MENSIEFWIMVASLIVAVASIGFNLWQHHRYSKTTHALRGSLSAWWHWSTAMKNHIEMYWDAVGKGLPPEEIKGVAKGTLDGLAKYSGRLAEDIARTTMDMGFDEPWRKPWKESEGKKSKK